MIIPDKPQVDTEQGIIACPNAHPLNQQTTQHNIPRRSNAAHAAHESQNTQDKNHQVGPYALKSIPHHNPIPSISTPTPTH
jgi:hypothetical protein